MQTLNNQPAYLDPRLRSEGYYRDLQRKNLLRLILIYLAPLVILSVYFNFQYHSMLKENAETQLKTVADSYASTLDMFLQDRIAAGGPRKNSILRSPGLI